MKLFIVLPLYVFLALLVEGLREKVRGLRVVRLGQVSLRRIMNVLNTRYT